MEKYIPTIFAGLLAGQLIALSSVSGLAFVSLFTFIAYMASKKFLE